MWWKWVPDNCSNDREAQSDKLSCSDSWNEQITLDSWMETRMARDTRHYMEDVAEAEMQQSHYIKAEWPGVKPVTQRLCDPNHQQLQHHTTLQTLDICYAFETLSSIKNGASNIHPTPSQIDWYMYTTSTTAENQPWKHDWCPYYLNMLPATIQQCFTKIAQKIKEWNTSKSLTIEI